MRSTGTCDDQHKSHPSCQCALARVLRAYLRVTSSGVDTYGKCYQHRDDTSTGAPLQVKKIDLDAQDRRLQTFDTNPRCRRRAGGSPLGRERRE